MGALNEATYRLLCQRLPSWALHVGLCGSGRVPAVCESSVLDSVCLVCIVVYHQRGVYEGHKVMEKINVKLVARLKVDPSNCHAINARIRDLATSSNVKQYGWERTDLHVRALKNDRAEVSLNVQLTPTEIPKRK